jgi:hypothetical protein
MDWQFTKLEAVVKDASFADKSGNLEYIDLRFTRVYMKSKQAGAVYETEVPQDQSQAPSVPSEYPIEKEKPAE